MLIVADGENIRQPGGLAAKARARKVEVIMLPMLEGAWPWI